MRLDYAFGDGEAKAATGIAPAGRFVFELVELFENVREGLCRYSLALVAYFQGDLSGGHLDVDGDDLVAFRELSCVG